MTTISCGFGTAKSQTELRKLYPPTAPEKPSRAAMALNPPATPWRGERSSTTVQMAQIVANESSRVIPTSP